MEEGGSGGRREWGEKGTGGPRGAPVDWGPDTAPASPTA